MKNTRKKLYSIVWHESDLKQVTNDSVGGNNIILNNLIKVKKNSVRLAKIGDLVEFKDLSILPDRCSVQKNIRITYFSYNGSIGTTGDLYKEFDGSNFSHFKKPLTTPT